MSTEGRILSMVNLLFQAAYPSDHIGPEKNSLKAPLESATRKKYKQDIPWLTKQVAVLSVNPLSSKKSIRFSLWDTGNGKHHSPTNSIVLSS